MLVAQAVVTSMPSKPSRHRPPGIRMSVITTSGPSLRTASSSSSALPTAPTTATSPDISSSRLVPSRTR